MEDQNFLPSKSFRETLSDCPLELRNSEMEWRRKQMQKAKQDLMFNHYKKYLGDNPRMYVYSDLDDEIIPLIEESYRNSTYAFITINCDEAKWNFKAFLVKLLKEQFNYVNRWIACIEYFTETGQHPHCHMLIEKKPEFYSRAPQSKIIDDYFRRFKDFVADRSKIDVRMPKNPASRYGYILGRKKDPIKQGNHLKDEIWRIENGIQPSYGNWTQDRTSEAGLVGSSVVTFSMSPELKVPPVTLASPRIPPPLLTKEFEALSNFMNQTCPKEQDIKPECQVIKYKGLC